MYDIDDPGKASWSNLPNHCWEDDPSELIDFPCSNIFLRHYHSLGLTPRCPEPDTQSQIDIMTTRINRLEDAIQSKRSVQPPVARVFNLPPSESKRRRRFCWGRS